MAKAPSTGNANVVTPAPTGVVEPGSTDAAAALAAAPVEPVGPAAPSRLLVTTSGGQPSLEALNRRSHEVSGVDDQLRNAAIEAAKKAIENAFKIVKV